MQIPRPVAVGARSVLGALSVLIYIACWEPVPARVIQPVCIGLFWISVFVWLFIGTAAGTLSWKRPARVFLVIVWVLHAAARWFLDTSAPVERAFPPLYALAVVSPTLYMDIYRASISLAAFTLLLGPWQRGNISRRKR